MTPAKTGLYRLYWTTGGNSLVAVGSLEDGTRWFAATNWTAAESGGVASTDWEKVVHAEALAVEQSITLRVYRVHDSSISSRVWHLYDLPPGANPRDEVRRQSGLGRYEVRATRDDGSINLALSFPLVIE